MVPPEGLTKKVIQLLDTLNKCHEGTLFFLFGTITINTIVVSVFLGYLVGSIYPTPPKDPSHLLMETLQQELRRSLDKEYCKVLVDRLIVLDQQAKQNVVINLPMNIAAVGSSN